MRMQSQETSAEVPTGMFMRSVAEIRLPEDDGTEASDKLRELVQEARDNFGWELGHGPLEGFAEYE
jgi:hypothetical protein